MDFVRENLAPIATVAAALVAAFITARVTAKNTLRKEISSEVYKKREAAYINLCELMLKIKSEPYLLFDSEFFQKFQSLEAVLQIYASSKLLKAFVKYYDYCCDQYRHFTDWKDYTPPMWSIRAKTIEYFPRIARQIRKGLKTNQDML